MFFYRNILRICILSFLLNSCSNELEIWDEWSNIPIVYCIINPKDSVHVIRINKASCGDLPLEEMAGSADSLIYDYDIDVQMTVFDQSNRLLQTCHFQKEYIQKDSVNSHGETVFSIQKHHVYVYRGMITDQGCNNYKIEFTLLDGKKVQATTTSLYKIRHLSIGPPPPVILDYSIAGYKNLSIGYSLPQDVGCRKIDVIFYYYEVLSSGLIQKKEIVFTTGLSKTLANKTNPDEVRTYLIPVIDILRRFRKEIDSTESQVSLRYLGTLSVEYYVGNEEFSNYGFYRLSTLNAEMERPNNIVGGYGLFAARRRAKVSRVRMDARTYDLFYDNLRNHKFRPANAYPPFLSSLPDSLQ